MNDVPDLPGAVLGYRWWIARDGRLLSPYRVHIEHVWEPGVNTAICLGQCPDFQREPVNADCECGLYGWQRLNEVALRHRRFENERVVAGVVAFWGRMFARPNGVRAQYARILGLLSPSDADIAIAYDLPVVDGATEFDNVATIPEFFAALHKRDKLEALREIRERCDR